MAVNGPLLSSSQSVVGRFTAESRLASAFWRNGPSVITTRWLNDISDYIKEDDDGALLLKLQTVCVRPTLTSSEAQRLRAFAARVIPCIENRSFVTAGVVLQCQDIRELGRPQ